MERRDDGATVQCGVRQSEVRSDGLSHLGPDPRTLVLDLRTFAPSDRVYLSSLRIEPNSGCPAREA